MSDLHPSSVLSTRVLEDRLEAFYQKPEHYIAFNPISDHPALWRHVIDWVVCFGPQARPVRVLEVGAGRSGFGSMLRSQHPDLSVLYVAQDVTDANRAHLSAEAAEVVIGRIEQVEGQYEVIFCTYVWEHVAAPLGFLQCCLDLLRPGGHLLIFSPRYDFLGYLSPSTDHYSIARRAGVAAYVCFRRLWTRLSGRPAFLVHQDPSVFHREWARDRDAVHGPVFAILLRAAE